MAAPFVVVGGGIAGVCCAEALAEADARAEQRGVVLVAASPLIKSIANFKKVHACVDARADAVC
jgi:glycine/D-amino acid oxidase-like deaminating enzyme